MLNGVEKLLLNGRMISAAEALRFASCKSLLTRMDGESYNSLTRYSGFEKVLGPYLISGISRGLCKRNTSGVPIYFRVPRIPPVSILPIEL